MAAGRFPAARSAAGTAEFVGASALLAATAGSLVEVVATIGSTGASPGIAEASPAASVVESVEGGGIGAVWHDPAGAEEEEGAEHEDRIGFISRTWSVFSLGRGKTDQTASKACVKHGELNQEY